MKKLLIILAVLALTGCHESGKYQIEPAGNDIWKINTITGELEKVTP
jgi:hypothetical protein